MYSKWLFPYFAIENRSRARKKKIKREIEKAWKKRETWIHNQVISAPWLGPAHPASSLVSCLPSLLNVTARGRNWAVIRALPAENLWRICSFLRNTVQMPYSDSKPSVFWSSSHPSFGSGLSFLGLLSPDLQPCDQAVHIWWLSSPTLCS